MGAESWVARTLEEYVEIATGLAADIPALANIRATLRDQMRASPLTDIQSFAREVETVYRHLWRTWCREEGASKIADEISQ
jgi:predicted O-linked N-acetylglucosamine transferase (SPINDLY family)